jgi:hypothetical protein
MGISRGNITTNIIKKGLVFNMDAANRGSYPKTGTTAINTINNTTGTLQSSGMFENINSGVFDFDGATNYIDFGRFISSENTSTISVSFWLKVDELGNATKYYLGYYIGNFGAGWLIEYGNGAFYFAVGDTTTGYQAFGLAANTNSITINTWNYFIMVYDGTQTGSANILKVYLNGTQKTLSGSPSFPSSIPTLSDAVLTIGGIKPASVTGGKSIGPVHIYNRALSASEVLFNYNGLKSRFGL